jgi:hypothetical protein
MAWSTGKKRMDFRMEKLRTDGRKHIKNKHNEYNAPKTIEDWQSLLADHEKELNDYPDIIERDKIIIEAEKIKEKIKNMQNEQNK